MSFYSPVTEKPKKIPPRAILSLDVFGREQSEWPSLLDVSHVKLTVNARSALALALRHAKIGQGASVLVPAFHCPAMISPIVWLGAEPLFYPILNDTSVDVEVLSTHIRDNTRAIIAVHYFGFIQDLRQLRQLCDERNIILIEDCAHAFFGSANGSKVGCTGDYAIGSIMKFLPIYEGGCLVSEKHSLDDIKIIFPNLFQQIQSALNTLEIANEYGRLSWIKYLIKLKNWMWKYFKSKQPKHEQLVDNSLSENIDYETYTFDPHVMDIEMSWFSRFTMSHMSFTNACELRRANYTELFNAFLNVAGVKPLYHYLPDNVCPQVFPLIVENSSEIFYKLKQLNIPIIRFGEYRWEGVNALTCPVSDHYSKTVFQFPCHQSMKQDELKWMINQIKNVLSSDKL